MSRQLEQVREDRLAREEKEALRAVYGGLVDAVGHSGGLLTGFSVKTSDVECLITLRVVLGGSGKIAFVVSDSFANALRKAVRLGNRDMLLYKADRYGT